MASKSSVSIWFLLIGILLTICGAVLVASPLLTAVAAEVFLGWVLLISGVATIVHSFVAKNIGTFAFWLLCGAMDVFFGFLVLTNLVAATIAIAILFAAYLMVTGIMKVLSSFTLMDVGGWLWMLLSGIISLILSFWFFSSPLLGAAFIGIIVGIDMMVFGLSVIALSMAIRRT